MVSFVCDVCNDVMTKPKVRNHRCRGASYHCLDCNVCFTQQTVQNHNSCITEAEKWHGKFANQRGAGSLNQRAKKNNNQQNQNNNQKTEKPAEQEKKKDEKSDKNSKRKRTSDASESESKHKKKKTKVEAPVEEAANFVINSDELKWKRKISKALKKADNKTMDKNDLKKKVVDALLKDLRTQFETSFDAQLQQAKYVKLDGSKVTLQK